MLDKILKILNEIFDESDREPIEALSEGMSLREDLGLDSLLLAELTVRIEAEFGIDIFEDGLVNTISEILSKLEKS